MPSFPCSYCEQTIDADDDLAGCMIVCGHCGRNVLTPQGVASHWPSSFPTPLSQHAAWIRTIVSTLAFGALGAAILGLLTFGLTWFVTFRFVGLGISDAATAGWIGAGLGGFFAGLVAWRVARE